MKPKILCPECQTEIKLGTEVCPKCGKSLEWSDVESDPRSDEMGCWENGMVEWWNNGILGDGMMRR